MTKILLRSIFLAYFGVAVVSSGIANADSEMESVRQNLSKILPSNMPIDSVEPSAMENVYIAEVGTQTMYVYSKDEFVMVGDVYDTERRVNLGEERQYEAIAGALASIPESDMILMGEAQQRYVTVFTDTDCGYCQKFNKNIAELDKRGVQVRYLMFPRAGIGSASYHEAVSVWCAEDQARAMTIAKSGGTVDPKQCENPVAQQFELGQKIGIRGTPTIVLDNGKVIPGYLTPDQLLAEAGIENGLQ